MNAEILERKQRNLKEYLREEFIAGARKSGIEVDPLIIKGIIFSIDHVVGMKAEIKFAVHGPGKEFSIKPGKRTYLQF